MNPDKYQQAWQAHTSGQRVTVDADLLLKQVQRNQRDFRATILRRDTLEVGIGLLLLPYWLYKGATSTLPWTWYLTVPAIVWVVGYFVVDRIRHPQTPSDPGEPLLDCVTTSLAQVEHQIWLLRNVFWWYLLPFTISIQTFFAHNAWLSAGNWLEALGIATPFFMFLMALYAFLDYLNQRAVRWDVGPRRQELLELLASLSPDETTEENVATNGAKRVAKSGVLKRWFIVAVLSYAIFIVMMLLSGTTGSSYDGPARSSGAAGNSLAKLVTEQREAKNLVGLAAMVTVDGRVEAVAAHGERKVGSDVSLELGDRWHLGGITKSITATAIARLVESDQMHWSDTVGEAFLDGLVHDHWNPVTLGQLLTDTAGAPANFPMAVWHERPALGEERTMARREAVIDVIAAEPAYPPGEKNVYSNVGYTIAAAMAEKVTGDAWEGLVTREVFEPLKLTGAGFGPPKSSDAALEQPRGHLTRGKGKVAVDDTADNTPIIGPAATIHMTLADLCTFAEDHLNGQLAAGELLSDETYTLLHTPALLGYASGWIVREPSYDIPHRVYWHNGANTMWYALVVFIPDKNMVIAVTSNDGDSQQGEAAAWEIVKWSANRFKVEADAEARKFLPSAAYPKKAPFAAVRWGTSRPEVRVGDEWYRLVSLDDVPVEEIVAFSRKVYEHLWRKRFEEDLVELLSRMGHPPQDTVTLVVQSLTSSETLIWEDMPMTAVNRKEIRDAAQRRDESEP